MLQKTRTRVQALPSGVRQFLKFATVGAMNTSPDVGRSIPEIMFMRVDLPLPDLPIIATNSPRSTLSMMLSRAVNGPAAVSNTLVTLRSSINVSLPCR